MNASSSAWLLVKVTLLLVAALSFDAVLRRRWVLTTAALWNAVLLALLILPVATVAQFRFELPLLPPQAKLVPTTVATADTTGLSTEHAGLHSNDQPANHSPSARTLSDDAADKSFESSDHAISSSPILSMRLFWTAIGWIYVAGVVAVLLRLAASWRAVNGLLRRAEPVTDTEWIKRLHHWQSALVAPAFAPAIAAKSRCAVRLLESDDIDVPVALGVRRRAIVIPAPMVTRQSRAAIDAILVHELAHLLRADCAWQWVQRIVEAVWWFHPLVWLARPRIAFVRERACDDFAVHALGDVDGYAHSLLAVASVSALRPSFGLEMAVVRRGSLSRRLEAIQQTQGNSRYNASRMVRGTCTLAMVCGTLLLAGVVVGRAATDPTNASEPAKSSAAGTAAVAADVEKSAQEKAPSQAQGKAEQPAAASQPALLKEALEGFEKSRQAIVPYDVHLTVSVTIPMTTVIVDAKDPDHPNIAKQYQWRPLEAGEKPTTRTSVFRQVLSRDGKRRVETNRDDVNGNQNSVAVDDGKVVRVLSGKNQGTIQPSQQFRVQQCEEYRNYLGDLMGLMTLQSLLRERPGTRLIENDKPDTELVGVLLPVGDGPSLKQFDFRMWLDRRHGFLPSKIETYRREGEDLLLSNRMLVSKFHEAQPGVWVPVDMTQTAYNIQPGEYRGHTVNLYHATADVAKSQWHAELGDELFLLPYPVGIQVTDFVNNLQITTGEGDDGRDLQALIKGAATKLAINTLATMRRQQADLAKVRPEDREPSEALRKYGAFLKANKDGEITSVGFEGSRRDGLGSPDIDDAGLQYVAKLSKLEHLSLSNTRITNDGLPQLRGLVNLKILSLTNTNITDDGVKQLETLVNLEWLFLDNNQVQDGRRIRYLKITNDALRHLQPLQKLTHLQLYGTGVTDAGLEYLKGLAKLTQVSLEGSDVTRDGAQKLRAARPGLRVLID